MFCRSLFVLLYFLFWPLCCLFFDIRFLITLLVSSNSSYIDWLQNEQCFSYNIMTRISFNGGRVLSIKYNERGLYLRHGFFLANFLYCDSQQFHQYQQIEPLSLTSTRWTYKRHRHITLTLEIHVLDWDRHVSGLNRLMG